ncbi:CidA/LrgA family protein [Chloroflexus aggregans]|jgi:holin-like protein|uniref:LrgA family protein n=1 Tax=Chloroflexus aggregans (strain MD-66 / DSM 9485) TaxID=326427 RepID=B8GAY6_CHLAD|nr:CidA/LrgA family protein [Chloroflexus aggregans]ACL26586.1 LrgA family protein [Chloroflexus aggregans DSM 9485]
MMIDALLGILLCQLIGEVISRGLRLPVPGPVVGMLLLFAILRWRGGPPPQLSTTAHGLLAHLPLLFVPAGVGVIVHIPLLIREGLPLFAAIIVSTIITLLVTGLTVHWLYRRK